MSEAKTADVRPAKLRDSSLVRVVEQGQLEILRGGTTKYRVHFDTMPEPGQEETPIRIEYQGIVPMRERKEYVEFRTVRTQYEQSQD